MKTARDLLINTVFYLMSIRMLMGALSRLFAELKAIIAHTIGGPAAAFVAHWVYVLVSLI